MNKLLALFAIALGLVYSELGSTDFINGLLFPALLVGGLLYLSWFKGFIAILAAGVAFHFMDIEGQGLFTAILLPIFFGICLIYLLFWSFTTILFGDEGLFGDGGCGGDGGGFDGGCGGD